MRPGIEVILDGKGLGEQRNVKVRPGSLVVLSTAADDPTWQKLGAAFPQPSTLAPDKKSLTFVMDRNGDFAGEYAVAAQGGQPSHLQVARPQSMWSGFPLLLVVLVGFALFASLLVGLVRATDFPVAVRAYTLAGLIVAAALGLLHGLSKKAGGQGVQGLFVGADQRASTSKTQYMLWTIGIAFALTYIGAWAIMDSSDRGNFVCNTAAETKPADRNCVNADAWEAYLILLGVPAAAAVVAKGVNSSKIVNGTLQKTTAGEGEGGFFSIATDDNGKADIADVQYLVFNLVTLLYVAAIFIQTGVLGEVPAILLGLTSTAAATYTLNKSLQANAPRITSVAPLNISAGNTVTIAGTNLFPPSTTVWRERNVTIGGAVAVVQGAPDRTKGVIVATAPPGMATAPEAATVTVTTASGTQTEGFRVTIA